jgi:hypothetical protein
MPGERVPCLGLGINPSERFCHAIALWHECGYAENLGERLTGLVLERREDPRTAVLQEVMAPSTNMSVWL